MNNEAECEEIKNVSDDEFDETQMHAWIHPNGWFEMNIKSRNPKELGDMVNLVGTVFERY